MSNCDWLGPVKEALNVTFLHIFGYRFGYHVERFQKDNRLIKHCAAVRINKTSHAPVAPMKKLDKLKFLIEP